MGELVKSWDTRLVEFCLRHGRTLWLLALALAVPAAIRTGTMYAHLRADVEALLPKEAPSVVAANDLRHRMTGLKYLGVLVDTGDAAGLAKGEEALDALAAKIEAYGPDLVTRVRKGNDEEKAFLEKNAPLYLTKGELVSIQSRIDARRDWEVSQSTGSALEDDTEKPPLDFSDIETKYKSKLGGGGGSQTGTRFSSAEKHLTMLLVEVGPMREPGHGAATLLGKVRADAATAVPAGMRVGYTGDVAIEVEETEALLSDLSISSALVLGAVLLVLWLYFRWWRALLALFPPLLLAALFAFGAASLPPFNVRELNSNTAFLGSIVVGNGINFAIILLARYVEERRAGMAPRAAILAAVTHTRNGTLTAAAGAGVSYAALSLTEFQGFRQFGFIGGLGMLFSWLVAYVLIPPALLFLDRDEKTAPQPRGERLAVFRVMAGAVERFPKTILAVALGLSVLSGVAIRSRYATALEYDFSKLRRADTWQSGEGYWGHRMDDLLGRYLTPMAVLTDGPEQTAAVKAKLEAEQKDGPLAELVSELRTIDDVLPTEQPEKVRLATDLRESITPRMLADMAPDKRKVLDRFLGNGDLKPIGIEDLPSTFTVGLRERDGQVGRVVLVYPKPSSALWDGPKMVSLVAALRRATQLPDAQVQPRVTGSLPVSADIVSALGRDGPKATFFSFVGVVLVVVLLFRRVRVSALVIGSLVVGVLWLAGATLGFGIKVNFANFIAFPITFGIGVDYPVNVLQRFREGGKQPLRDAIVHAGSAVALCSATTIIGYASLLVAQNRALFLFGLIAVLGEIACLATALLVAPSVLRLGRAPASTSNLVKI